MNLRQIEIFHSVMRHQTTIRAAKELLISQPAVSNALKQIESQIGFALFDRVGNRLLPREEARVLFRASEPLLQLSSVVSHTVRALHDNRTGRIAIFTTPPLGDVFIPKAIDGFLRDREVNLFFDVCPADQVVEAVETGAADFGVALGIEANLSTIFEFIPLGTARMVCICPNEHPFSTRESVGPGDFDGVTLIGLDPTTRMGTTVAGAFRAERVEYQPSIQVRYCRTACTMVTLGTGVAIVDHYSALSHLSDGALIRPFTPRIEVGAQAIYLKSRPPSRLASALLGSIRKSLAESSSVA